MLVDELFNYGSTSVSGTPAFECYLGIGSKIFTYKEEKDKWTVEIPLPGLTTEDVKIRVNKNDIIVTPEKKTAFVVKGISKTIDIPENVNKKAITASITNGILSVIMPKLEEDEFEVKLV